jgi:hypothetical protein
MDFPYSTPNFPSNSFEHNSITHQIQTASELLLKESYLESISQG